MNKITSFLLTPVVCLIAIQALTNPAEAKMNPTEILAETPKDQPWAEITRSLQSVTDLSVIQNTLSEKAPGLLQQIQTDAKTPSLFSLWGLSRNIDQSNMDPSSDHYLERTTPRNLLNLFIQMTGVPYDDDRIIGHAGITHTYGYLFSILPTPYGFKRARYVDGEIEAGFGLPANLFGGQPQTGTLLSNFTHFIGAIAFRSHPNALKDFVEIFSSIPALPPELKEFDYLKINSTRITEVVETESFELKIYTDYVPFTHGQTRGNSAGLLIYSIDFHHPGEPERPQLITAFPIDSGFLKSGQNTPPDDSAEITLRFNAALPVQLPNTPLIGKRY